MTKPTRTRIANHTNSIIGTVPQSLASVVREVARLVGCSQAEVAAYIASRTFRGDLQVTTGKQGTPRVSLCSFR